MKNPTMKKSTMVTVRTITEPSLLLMIPIIPAKKADMPEIIVKKKNMPSARSLKDGSSTRLGCCSSMVNRKKTIIPTNNPIDHFPRVVLGLK